MFKVDSAAPTDSVVSLAGWCLRQFQRIASMWGDDVESVTFRVLHAAPTRIKPGMVIYADGVDLDPGSGEGLYRRNKGNSAWVHLG